MSYYPAITSGPLMALSTIKQQLDLDAGYLDRDDCMYDEQTKEDIRKLLAPTIIEVPKIEYVEKIVERKVEVAAEASKGGGQRGPKAKGNAAANADVIDKELMEVLADLRSLKLNSKTLLPKDKLDIMKVQATLLERFINSQEKNTNIKKMSLFMSTVMGILDDLMPEDTRQLFMKRLQPFVDSE